MRRLVPAAAVVLLAIASARSIQLDYAPALSLPELTVQLTMPAAAATDPIETTTRWIVPVESSIRALGDVLAMRGEIGTDTATITVRFRRGTDPELKVARLASELAGVRARLPRDARLAVWPSGQTGARPSAFLALTGTPDAAKRVADELRTVAGARDVEVYGGTDVETEVRLARGQRIGPEELLDAIVPHHLGTTRVGARQMAVGSEGIDLDRAVRQRVAGARAVTRHSTPFTVSRLNGKPAVMLAVLRDDDVSLFEFDAALRAKVRQLALEEVWSEASEMRKMLTRLAFGALAAMLILGAGGFAIARRRGLLLAAYVPLAIAIAINFARIGSARIDAFTLLVATVAIAGVAPLAASRLTARREEVWPGVITACFFALLPIATALGSGRLAPLLASPARAFAVTGLAAILAVYLIPIDRTPRVAPGSRSTRRALRDSAGVVLACIAATCVLLAWFGVRLDPRRAGQSIERGRLYIRIALPAGTTIATTSAAVANLEKELAKVGDVGRFWSVIGPARASIVLELKSAAQSVERLRLLRIRLQSLARLAPGSVSIGESFDGGGGGRFSDDLEDRAEADEEGYLYRVLLKSTDAEALLRLHEELATRLAKIGVRRAALEPEWAASTTRLELVPKAETSPELTRVVAEAIAEQTLPARGRPMPGGRVLRVIPDGAPKTMDDVPQRADVFTRTYEGHTIPALFTPQTRIVIGRVTRELGRFVLPVRVRVPGWNEDKLRWRGEIDRTIGLMAPPAGTVIERPSLSKWSFSAAKLRLLGLAAFLPVLLLAAATVVLSSFGRALGAVAPAILGVACAAPMLLLTGSEVDEITLVGLAAAVCCTVPITVISMLRASGGTVATYRAVRHVAVPMLFAALAVAAMLGVAASGPEAVRSGWRAPMVATAAVLVVPTACGALLPGALLFVARDASRRVRVGKAIAHPAAWREQLPNTLSVRNLSKTYAGGFRALRHVSFELTPGVIGLLGPNGAGKTTLLRTLTGLLLPTRGQIVFRGVPVTPENLADYRRFVGFLPQEFNAYSGLTAAQFLDYWMIERGITDREERGREIERLLALVDLTEHADRHVRDYSGGMRQRIGIARALIGDPPLLVVDEPTTGLDIEARARFRDLMHALAKDRVVILSTHIAGDVEDTASRILLIVRGELRWDGTPEALIARAQGRVFETLVSDPEARAMSRRYRITTRVRTASGIRIRGVARPGEELPGAIVEPTLEEAYLAEASEGQVRLGSFSFLAEA